MTTAMVRCTQPGCDGTIQEGYYDAAGDDLRQARGQHDRLVVDDVRRQQLTVVTPDQARRVELVDLANAIRPRTLT